MFLDEWISEEPNNPEVYIAFFNYHLNKGRISGLAIESKSQGNKHIAITDPDSGEVVGYINNSNTYKAEDLKKAFEYISKGISIAPNRLDMHFGKTHLLGQIKDYQKQCTQMIKILELSKSNDNKWLWDNNKILEDGELFMLHNMQDYISNWINDGSSEGLEALKRFSENEIELYPEIVLGYNNYAYYFIMTNGRKTALKWFLEAEKVDEKDSIVLLNIARTYMQNNNIDKAKEYLEKVIEIDDPQYAQYAKEQLNKIK